MQVRYQGFRLIGSEGTAPKDLFNQIMASPAVDSPFFKEFALGNWRTIPLTYDSDSDLFKGIVLTTSQLPDLLTLDEASNKTYLFQLEKPQIKMNFFIFYPPNNAGLYTSYDESLNIQDFAKILSQPFRRLNELRHSQDSPESDKRIAKVKFEKKYFPHGRKSLKLVYIVSDKTFNEMLKSSSGIYDLDIVVDAEKIVPALSSRSRMKKAIKTARLNIQFDKEFLNRTVRVAQAIISELNAEGYKAKLVENARERTIYNSSNKEYFNEEPYEVIRPYLTTSLIDFAECGLFDKMKEMVSNHSLFNPEPIESDDDD